jgi:hypothetical protein
MVPLKTSTGESRGSLLDGTQQAQPMARGQAQVKDDEVHPRVLRQPGEQLAAGSRGNRAVAGVLEGLPEPIAHEGRGVGNEHGLDCHRPGGHYRCIGMAAGPR